MEVHLYNSSLAWEAVPTYDLNETANAISVVNLTNATTYALFANNTTIVSYVDPAKTYPYSFTGAFSVPDSEGASECIAETRCTSCDDEDKTLTVNIQDECIDPNTQYGERRALAGYNTMNYYKSVEYSEMHYSITTKARLPEYENGYLNISATHNGEEVASCNNVEVTDSEGNFAGDCYEDDDGSIIVGLLANGKYTITIHKGGYKTVTEDATVDCTNCPTPFRGYELADATWNQDKCRWDCNAGYTYNESREQCDKTSNNNDKNQTNNTIVTTSCNADADCSDTQYCSAGVCLMVTGDCGYASNHKWVKYECCQDSDCAATQKCSAQHICIEKTYELDIPKNATVGYNLTVKALEEGTPMPNATVSVKLPSGKTITLTTNTNGQATLFVEYVGEYTASLLGQDKVLKSKSLEALAKITDNNQTKKTAPIWEDSNVRTAAIVLVIGGVLGAAYLYFRGKGAHSWKGQKR